MSNELTTIDFNSPKTVETIRKLIAHNASDEEFQLFLQMCKGTGLNPFLKEIWFIKPEPKSYKDKDTGEWKKTTPKIQMMVGVAGFYRIANDHPMFDGIENELQFDAEGKVYCSTSKVWRKDRKFPAVATAYMSEYFKETAKGDSVWETKGSVMLTKASDSLALRKAFPHQLNGLYTEEEMPKQFETPAIEAPKDFKYMYDVPDKDLNPEIRKKLIDAYKALNAKGLAKLSEDKLRIHSTEPISEFEDFIDSQPNSEDIAISSVDIAAIQAEEAEAMEAEYNRKMQEVAA